MEWLAVLTSVPFRVILSSSAASGLLGSTHCVVWSVWTRRLPSPPLRHSMEQDLLKNGDSSAVKKGLAVVSPFWLKVDPNAHLSHLL